MTKEEFIAIYRKTNKQFNIVGIAFLTSFAGITFIAASILNFIKKHEVANWVRLVPATLLFGSLAFFAIMAWYLHYKAKKRNLTCSSCKKLLLGQLGNITIASGNCGNCGQPVFDK
ncbi:MAG: hypothetical protein PHF37_06595 [Phycisphaerae bacterium]|nr:hypothetical protein [Phycisphaerae bacterium]